MRGTSQAPVPPPNLTCYAPRRVYLEYVVTLTFLYFFDYKSRGETRVLRKPIEDSEVAQESFELQERWQFAATRSRPGNTVTQGCSIR